MPTSNLPIFSKVASPGTRVKDPVHLNSVPLNSNGPSPLNGQIQMSAAWDIKICGQISQRGDSRSVQMLHLCPFPPPPTRPQLSV